MTGTYFTKFQVRRFNSSGDIVIESVNSQVAGRLMPLRRPNVSRSVVQRLMGSILNPKTQKSRRPVPGRTRATTPAEDRFLALSARRRRTTTVPQLVADHFQASGRRISATTVRNRLHNAGL
ncbi:HTH_Tnp_Tc3_2 domain-containing protein [Trichonephila clavipes]|nr:HTH_Tnp_Tc3_2 domain-containing protein [Trichonephila clavipes]